MRPALRRILFGGVSAAAGAAFTTLDPVNIGNHITLSNGNLTATMASGSGGAQTARSLHVIPSGSKRRFEFTVESSPFNGVGVCDSVQDLNSAMFGNSHGISLATNGHAFIGFTDLGAQTSALSTGDVVGVEVDDGAKLIYFVLNGGSRSTGQDYSSLGATIYAAVTLNVTAGSTTTINLGSSPWLTTATAGYSGIA